MSTPEAFLKSVIVQQLSATEQQAEAIWFSFEAYCQRIIRTEYPDSAYAAIVLDGEGGVVIGIDVYKE